jgi:hypothetical protein
VKGLAVGVLPRAPRGDVERLHTLRPKPSLQRQCDWPEIVAPNGWRLRVPLGAEFGWWVSSWPSCPNAELPVQHPGVPRSRGYSVSEGLPAILAN